MLSTFVFCAALFFTLVSKVESAPHDSALSDAEASRIWLCCQRLLGGTSMTNKFIPCQKYLWAMYGPNENPDNIKGNVRLLISIKGFPLEDWCFTGKLSGILEEVKRDIEAEKKAEEDKKARKA